MRIYQIKKRKKQRKKKKMREGVDYIAAVTDRHAKSALIKGLQLQRQRAQGPALLCSPKLQNTSKRRERNYTASCGASRKPNTRERKKDFEERERVKERG